MILFPTTNFQRKIPLGIADIENNDNDDDEMFVLVLTSGYTMNLEVPPATAPHKPFLKTEANVPSVLVLEFDPRSPFNRLFFKFKLKNDDSEKVFADS